MLLQSIQFLNNSKEIIIFEGTNNSKNLEMIKAIQGVYNPNIVIIKINNKNFEHAKQLMPFLKHYQLNNEESPIVYVCENYICKLPTTDKNVVLNLISEK